MEYIALTAFLYWLVFMALAGTFRVPKGPRK